MNDYRRFSSFTITQAVYEKQSVNRTQLTAYIDDAAESADVIVSFNIEQSGWHPTTEPIPTGEFIAIDLNRQQAMTLKHFLEALLSLPEEE